MDVEVDNDVLTEAPLDADMDVTGLVMIVACGGAEVELGVVTGACGLDEEEVVVVGCGLNDEDDVAVL